MLSVALASVLLAGAIQEPPVPGTTLRLDLRLSPVLDQYFGLRVRSGGPPSAAPEDEAHVQALRELERAVGSPLAMGLVEGRLGDCRTAADLRAAFESLPETARLRDGTELRLREPALAVADALVAGEAAFLESVWPTHEPALERQERRLIEALDDEHLDAITADLARWLGFDAGAVELPVVLVTAAPDPGAFTHRSRQGAVTFVAVGDEELATGLLCEIVVHEAIHALDVSPPGRVGLLVELRHALTERGVGPADPLQREAVHTLMFLAAAAAVRDVVDPQHRDYGDVRGYYARAGRAAEVEREPWRSYLAGELDRSGLVQRIVDALAPEGDR